MTVGEFKSTLEDLFGLPHGKLQDSDSRATVSAWTSLADVQILALASEALGQALDPEELGYETVGELVEQLQEMGAF